MGSVSVNFQVRSFCDCSSVPPILMTLPFFSFFRSTFSLLSLTLVLLALSMFSDSHFIASPHIRHLWDYRGQTETQVAASTLSSLRPTTISPADVQVRLSNAALFVPHLQT